MNKRMLPGILMLASGMALGGGFQSAQQIQDAINQFVQSALEAGGKYEINLAQPDPRLQLPNCEQALQVFAQTGEIKPGRNTVGVRCYGDKGWTIYSTVLVKSFKDVFVLNKSMLRNDIIRQEHLNVETRDAGMLPQGYVTDISDVLDKQAARNIPAGSVLNRQLVTDPTVVRRGERVNIESSKAGVVISAVGAAMSDGAKGQKISVRNLSSKRVIQAVVVNAGQVSVNF
ncbi:flagellar basal body P-ring formation chaperone FlgA [Methylomonas koyamae]|uniref:flagellar basal body P-ring formation chaperone FlgA n=1 Tax=Methylomonas koyamae TaxID=702114 RepID=UPI0006D1B1AE|nr:flagellar basal body P-ring formation chaperone FlgA [Methylomonas koyamae]